MTIGVALATHRRLGIEYSAPEIQEFPLKPHCRPRPRVAGGAVIIYI
jgi:hypothetical protein